MSDAERPAPVIVVKKKSGHGGHHGGAWKVAYADFVTAMMALFIVLWLLSSDEKVKKAVGGYFQDPLGHGKLMGSTLAGAGDGILIHRDDMGKLKEVIENAIRQIPKIDAIRDQVKITVTGEGLRIELLENETGTFFESGRPNPSQQGQEILKLLARQLGALPNALLIEGHTDARPYASTNGYTNWELSVDRANAARRLMESDGLRPGQVAQVRGFADRSLRDAKNPEHASNRRISVIVKYQEADLETALKSQADAPPSKDEKPAKPQEVPSSPAAGH
jgi:chemotaxis protein MotB